jgi:two-component sensor histidine kinase
MSARSSVRRIPVVALILALILALATPSIGFSAILLLRADDVSRNSLSIRAAQGVDSIGDTLDRELRNMVTNLSVFAASGWVETQAYDQLHRRASTALRGTDMYLVGVDGDLNQLLNTRVPWGTPFQPLSSPEPVRLAMETGRPAVSNVFMGRIAREEVFNLTLPLISGESEMRALILSRSVAGFDNIFVDSAPPPGWRYAVLDGAGQRVAGETPLHASEGELLTLCGAATPGLHEVEIDGVTFSAAAEISPTWGWTSCVWTSSDQASETISRRWQSFTIMSLVIVSVTILAGAALGRMLAASIMRAATVGRALDAGGDVPEQRSIVREVDEVLGTLTRAARRRLHQEEELKLLLRETAHRAKNQIAITSALLRLSARTATSVPQLRDDVTARLTALARSIDMMPATAKGDVPLRPLVMTQLEPFNPEGSNRLRVSGEDLRVPASLAQSLGLVLHELATNASKYGAWSVSDGYVAIQWRTSDRVLTLTWTEQGGPPTEEPSHSGFGSSLIEMLIERSLGGKVIRDFRPTGLVCEITVPLTEEEPQA